MNDAGASQLVDGMDAVSTILSHGYRSWKNSERNPDHAGTRLVTGKIIEIDHAPKFQLSRSDTVFTIGSCFARNVEEKLVLNGVRVVTADFGLTPDRYQFKTRSNSALNKYSTSSIFSHLEELFTQQRAPQDSMIELDDGTWFDPHASLTKPADLATVLDTRALIDATMNKARESNYVFITLGLTESWIDKQTGLVLNIAPSIRMIKKYPGRFAWFNNTFVQCLDHMEQTLRLIWKYCREDMRIVVTVSPVPLQTTFAGRDVIVANTYSKSVLRAVADTLFQKYDLVDYFPSFEMVMNSPRDITWDEDQIHVKDSAVAEVIGKFIKTYLRE
jgi:hypothetical protein